jgi:hypothetical protein
VKWDELLALDRDSTAKPPTTAGASAGKFTLYLAGGDQLRGEPARIENETLQWKSQSVGEMSVPLKRVAAILRAGHPAPSPAGSDEKRTEDVVLLTNGDSVRGIVSGIADGTIKVQSQGTEVPVPLENVSAVMLASTGGADAAPAVSGRAFRVRLADDSTVTATSLRMAAGSKVALALVGGGNRELPFDAVAAIEQLNGPVSWLSSRRPVENVQTPLLDTTRPARMDRTVSGKPIRFGDRTYARGIGVTPYSRLTWDLPADGKYKALRTQYAIDGNGAYADVAVRIKLDGKVVHERGELFAGELSPVVVVPLGSARKLTLEVDFGANYNVQDRFDWIEPALVTAAAIPAPPAPPPPAATAPAAPAPPASAPASIPTIRLSAQ